MRRAAARRPPPALSPTLHVSIHRSPSGTDDLTHSGSGRTAASWTEVWVYRDGTLIAQTANDGEFVDSIRLASGSYTYQVCVPNATDCSNSTTVTF